MVKKKFILEAAISILSREEVKTDINLDITDLETVLRFKKQEAPQKLADFLSGIDNDIVTFEKVSDTIAIFWVNGKNDDGDNIRILKEKDQLIILQTLKNILDEDFKEFIGIRVHL
jgi:Icc-related predicted phosphoesterase